VPLKLVLVAFFGLAMVGVTFGMARYGYGLFLPQFVETFSLGKPMQGLIGSGSYAGYLLATIFASWFSGHMGPRYPLALGGICAAVGTALVAMATSPTSLAMGVVIAGASPGMVFPALSDWVSIQAAPQERNRLFTIMNSGTGAGIILATPLAWLPADQWRYAWWGFAAFAVSVGTMAVLKAPGAAAAKQAHAHHSDTFNIRMLVAPDTWTLYFVSGVSGLITAIYWAFSVELIARSELHVLGIDRPELVFWMVTGFSGFLGAFAGNAVNNNGHISVLRYTMVAIALSLVLLGLFPSHFAAIMLSGFIFGAAFIFITGLLGVWSMMIFKVRPSAGFGVTFLFFTTGAMFGPSISGLLAPIIGQQMVFVLAGAAALSLCLTPQRRPVTVLQK